MSDQKESDSTFSKALQYIADILTNLLTSNQV